MNPRLRLTHPLSPLRALRTAAVPRHHFQYYHAQHSRRAKMSKTGHAERMAHEPRDPSVHSVVLARVDEINANIRTFRLVTDATGIRFLPGQWLDVFVPGIHRPGGFTITSPPSKARGRAAPPEQPGPATQAAQPPFLELAVQRSPDNVVARWLWQPTDAILSAQLHVRVGGSFVWPPPGVMPTTLRKIVFVAGGVGINPLMSIVSHLAEQSPGARCDVEFLYSLRDPGDGRRNPAEMLFLERLAGLFRTGGGLRGGLRLFLTPGDGGSVVGGGEEGQVDKRIEGLDVAFKSRRITIDDVAQAIGPDKRHAVVYVCGVPKMTDEFVANLTSPHGLGLEPFRVLYEKWW